MFNAPVTGYLIRNPPRRDKVLFVIASEGPYNMLEPDSHQSHNPPLPRGPGVMPLIPRPVKKALIRSVCALARPVSSMRLNNAVRRAPGAARLHLGAGGVNLAGWINLDSNFRTRPDILFDLTRPLPLPADSVALIYTEDFIEHIELEACAELFRECFRVLRPGGMLRVLTPDLALITRQYLERDADTLAWYHREFGVRTPAQMLNAAFHKLEHRFMYDRETLDLVLGDAGFQVHAAAFRQGLNPDLAALDRRRGCVAADAVKPGTAAH